MIIMILLLLLLDYGPESCVCMCVELWGMRRSAISRENIQQNVLVLLLVVVLLPVIFSIENEQY